MSCTQVVYNDRYAEYIAVWFSLFEISANVYDASIFAIELPQSFTILDMGHIALLDNLTQLFTQS